MSFPYAKISVGLIALSLGCRPQDVSSLIPGYKPSERAIQELQDDAMWGVTGSASGDLFGSSMAAGDFDGDGDPDLAIGAIGYETSFGEANAGNFYIYANDAGVLDTVPYYTIPDMFLDANQKMGWSLAAGDFNNDGYDDLVIAAVGSAGGNGVIGWGYGSALGITGPSLTLATDVSTQGSFGYAFAVGDFNHDGIDDLAVSSTGYSGSTGRVSIFDGDVAGLSTSPSVQLTGTQVGEEFGAALAVGDFWNGDGIDDLAVGSPSYDAPGGIAPDAGALTIFEGSGAGLDTTAVSFGQYGAQNEKAATTLSAGDFDDDGYTDLVVGGGAGGGFAGVRVYQNTTGNLPSPSSPTVVVVAPIGAVEFGTAIVISGENDPDDRRGVFIGAPGGATGGIYAYYAEDGQVPSGSDYTGNPSYQGQGGVLAAADFNLDGTQDIIIGAPTHSTVLGSDVGAVLIYNSYVDLDGDGELSDVDCDDNDPSISPNEDEIAGDGIDQDCDGVDKCYLDVDLDGYGTIHPTDGPGLDCDDFPGFSSFNTDCNDAEPAANPGATEIVGNGIDDDCDGFDLCYADADADNFGSSATVTSVDADCFGAGESPTDDLDCDDSDPVIFPGATEVVGDGIDQDCDTQEICYVDADGDAFGVSSTVISLDLDCTGIGESENEDDCDDVESSTNPGAAEVPGDGVDNNCDSLNPCYRDVDQDGYGSTNLIVSADGDCSDALESDNSLDCDDADDTIFPGGVEIAASGKDEDCDGTETCHTDGDGDRFGIPALVVSADGDCNDAGESLNATDCEDSNGMVSPAQNEVPGNGIDDDCDGVYACFEDLDGDGVGSLILVNSADADCTDPGESNDWDDCDDSDDEVSPLGEEVVGDGVDQDCDGTEACYIDQDRDGFGGGGLVDAADGDCNDPGESLLSNDCDDSNDARFPGAIEIPGDQQDQDCDQIELCYVDDDGDGWPGLDVQPGNDADCSDAGEFTSPSILDCNDNDAVVYPGAFDPPGDGIDQSCSLGETCYIDADGDGFGGDAAIGGVADCTQHGFSTETSDCNDANSDISPAADELLGNRIDENCDTLIACYQDNDGDGYGTLNEVVSSDTDCQDAGESIFSNDCDDTDSTIFPNAQEGVADTIDQNCDGLERCYIDQDGDGFGNGQIDSLTLTCDGFEESSRDGDCDDNEPEVFPEATETIADGIDQDCDQSDTCYVDVDRDGFGSTRTWAGGDLDCTDPFESSQNTDCNDEEDTIWPGANELVADGLDQDCDLVDRCYVDGDGDGYGTTLEVDGTDLRCQGAGESIYLNDCDDDDAAVSPVAVEVCNAVDDDCDGEINEEAGQIWYTDADGDGFGETPTDEPLCDAPLGTVAIAGDCNDADASFYPGAPESCEVPEDNNCDGFSGLDDNDGDGFASCSDCNDGEETISPGAVEVCNGIDDDCDGVTDPDTSSDAQWFFADLDGDGYGDPELALQACEAPDTSWVSNDRDCNDADAAYHPGAEESDCLDPNDYNCDGSTGQDDADGDGDVACVDCNDADAQIYSGATEVCDEVDQDCDGQIDEEASNALTWYRDEDGDGAGTDESLRSCGLPEGYAAVDGDCDDQNRRYHPGALENDCSDPNDYNCDNSVGYSDSDGDGVAACEDCNDANEDIAPGFDEACNDIDDNCNGAIDEGFLNTDFDAWADCVDDDDDNDLLNDEADPAPLDPDSDDDGLTDGLEAIAPVPEGCRCSSSSSTTSSSGWLLVLGALGAMLQRRRTR